MFQRLVVNLMLTSIDLKKKQFYNIVFNFVDFFVFLVWFILYINLFSYLIKCA